MRSIRRVFQFLTVLSVMVCASFIGTVASGQCDEQGREVYNETFQVDKQIDSIRNIEKAVVRNNAEGDQIVEFMLNKSNPPATRERWTVTYECSEDHDYKQLVELNGEWQVTVMLADLDGDPKMTISLPGLSAEVDMLDAANDDDLQLFLALVTATATPRMVAAEILKAVAAEMPQPPTPPSPPTTPYQQCVVGCPAPSSCVKCPETAPLKGFARSWLVCARLA